LFGGERVKERGNEDRSFTSNWCAYYPSYKAPRRREKRAKFCS